MRILMTGGTGDVGATAVRRLTSKGFSVLVVGRTEQYDIPGAEYAQCDITDYARLVGLMAGCDAVVHLAAIRAPFLAPSEELFRVNCTGTFNVYQAAAACGITRVVSASSINAVGYYFGIVDWELSYLPVDEAHRSFTSDVYSYSKQIDEATADYFWRREGISGVMLRLPAVIVPTDDIEVRMRERTVGLRSRVMEIAALDAGGRREFATELTAGIKELRESRATERPRERSTPPSRALRFYGDRNNMFTVIDARDSAQAIERALVAEYTGSHPLFVNDSHNTAGVSSRLLAELFYPDAPLRSDQLETDRYGETATLASIKSARDLIGYEPEYSVARFFQATDR